MVGRAREGQEKDKEDHKKMEGWGRKSQASERRGRQGKAKPGKKAVSRSRWRIDTQGKTRKG